MLLSELARGQAGVVEAVHGEGSVRRHLLDMGLTPNAVVTLQKTAPMGDPIQVTVRGYELTLRLSEADNVLVRALDPQDRPDAPAGADAAHSQADAGTAAAPAARAGRSPLPHPGLGEFGPAEEAYRAHARRAAAKTGPLTFALVGNQNCGKTTLFNQLTGSNQHVGNFPGVTVDRKDGAIRGHAGGHRHRPAGHLLAVALLQRGDRHAASSCSTRSPTASSTSSTPPTSSAISYLTMQLMELGIPMVLALNMMDEVAANGGTVRRERAGGRAGHPGGAHLRREERGHRRAGRPRPARGALPARRPAAWTSAQPTSTTRRRGAPLHPRASAHIVERPRRAGAGVPVRFAATKLVEGDELIARQAAA